MVVVVNNDLPGVVGRVGSFLGENNVNIAQLYLSRTSPGGVALSVYQVDQSLNAAQIAELTKVQHTLSVKQISL
jgi:D-3-phosphoglycerate dehydrogenase